jgi:hypothetical protein
LSLEGQTQLRVCLIISRFGRCFHLRSNFGASYFDMPT